MYCEKCFKPFSECACFTGKDRVRQYIDLVRKELLVMEDVVFHNGKYRTRVMGVDKEVKIIELTNFPLRVTLATLATDPFSFSEDEVECDFVLSPNEQKMKFKEWLQTVPEKYRTKLADIANLKAVKIKVIKEAELLDKDNRRVFKQIFPDIYMAMATKDYPGDSLTMVWRLGQ